MFTGFPEETIQFFLDLRFHNDAQFFHDEHDRYIAQVQQPFYDFITDLGPALKDIDPQMELRPYKALSRIHRDTRFSRDKSPYRDHLWISFRRAAEQKDGSVNYWFELGPDRLSWGLGTWGENKPLNERLRRQMAAGPAAFAAIIDRCDLPGHHMAVEGDFYKRIDIPEQLPQRLHRWYAMRDLYICQTRMERSWIFSRRILEEVQRDFETVAPIYRLLRGAMDEIAEEERAEIAKSLPARQQDEW